MGERPRGRFRVSIRTLVVAVAVIAFDAALIRGVARRAGGMSGAWGAIPGLIAYDVLAFFTVMATSEVIAKRRGGGFWSWFRMIVTLSLLAITIGLPLLLGALVALGLLW